MMICRYLFVFTLLVVLTSCAGSKLTEVTLNDGQFFKGNVVAFDSAGFLLESSLGIIPFKTEEIRIVKYSKKDQILSSEQPQNRDSVKREVEANSGAHHYFFSPSSYNLEEGSLLWSQRYLLGYSNFEFGVSKNLSLEVGVSPFAFKTKEDDDGIRFQHVAPKWSMAINPKLGVQAGLFYIHGYMEGGFQNKIFVAPYSGLTYGDSKSHFSLSYMSLGAHLNNDKNILYHAALLGYMTDLSESFSLISESIWITDFYPAGSIGIRYHRSRFSSELAIGASQVIPILYYNISYLFKPF